MKIELEDLTQEEMRDAIAKQWCPWCNSGPWKVLAIHTAWIHGVTATDIREMAFLFKRTSICSKEHSIACAKNPQCLIHSPNFRSQLGIKKVISKAGLQSMRKRLLAIPNKEEIRKRAGAASALVNSKPHPCSACGKTIPTAYPLTCSPKCRKIIRQRTALVSARTRVQLRKENLNYGLQTREEASKRMIKMNRGGTGEGSKRGEGSKA